MGKLLELSISGANSLAEVDFIAEKQGHKKNALIDRSIGRVKMIFALLIKVIVLYIQAIIV